MVSPWSMVKVKAPGQSSFPSTTPVSLGPNFRSAPHNSHDTSPAVPENQKGEAERSQSPIWRGILGQGLHGLFVPACVLSRTVRVSAD